MHQRGDGVGALWFVANFWMLLAGVDSDHSVLVSVCACICASFRLSAYILPVPGVYPGVRKQLAVRLQLAV